MDVLLSDQNNHTLDSHPDGLPVSAFEGVTWPTVDPARIYAAGYALGGLVALYAGVLEPRLAGVASIAGITPLRAPDQAAITGGNDALSTWHAIQPRLGWFNGREHDIPIDYDDLIATARTPTLVVAPKADRTCDHPALMTLLKNVAVKDKTAAQTLTVVETEYAPPHFANGEAYPAQGINRLSDEHQGILEAWLKNQTQ